MGELATRIKLLARCAALAVLWAASTLVSNDANAQSSACEQLKSTLSTRIEASGVRDYALDAVPAGTPVPPDARVIGTCDAGRTKVLYRKGGGKPLSSAPVATPTTTAASQASPVPRARASEATASSVEIAAPVLAAPLAQAPVLPAQVPVAASAPPPLPRSEEAVAAPLAPRPELPSTPITQRAFGFAAENWKWLLVLVLLPAAGWLWAWFAHRSAYDKAGLPRGPKL